MWGGSWPGEGQARRRELPGSLLERLCGQAAGTGDQKSSWAGGGHVLLDVGTKEGSRFD